jgi:SAM-dependent methyltransferase
VPENYFDERIASTYEAKWPHLFESAVVDPAVDFLADLARSGTALELGIGTGRLALPLSRRGVRVHGIDLSPAMIAQLRAQPGADSIGVTIGDFATATVNQTFGLAYLVRNTITPLLRVGLLRSLRPSSRGGPRVSWPVRRLMLRCRSAPAGAWAP